MSGSTRGKLTSKSSGGKDEKRGEIFLLISLGGTKRDGEQLTFYSIFSGGKKYAGCYGSTWTCAWLLAARQVWTPPEVTFYLSSTSTLAHSYLNYSILSSSLLHLPFDRDMTYSIFPISSNFPIMTTILWEIVILCFGKQGLF